MVALDRRPNRSRVEPQPNAVVDYVDAADGRVLASLLFHDPFLAEDGELGYDCGSQLTYRRTE